MFNNQFALTVLPFRLPCFGCTLRPYAAFILLTKKRVQLIKIGKQFETEFKYTDWFIVKTNMSKLLNCYNVQMLL